MKKIVLVLFVLCSVSASQTTTRLAELSNLSYSPKKITSRIVFGVLKGFVLVNKLYDDKTGFGAVAYLHPQRHEVIVAYRGTSNTKDIVADIAIANITVFNNENESAQDIISNILNEMLTVAKLKTLSHIIELNTIISSQLEKKIQPPQIVDMIKEMDPFYARELQTEKKLWDEYSEEKKAKRQRQLTRLLTAFTRNRRRVKPLDHLKNNLQRAKDFFLETRKKVSDSHRSQRFKWYVTGHSLGGGYAQVVGATYQVPTETFAAPGMDEVFRKFWGVPHMRTVKNHMHMQDLVPKVGKHIGQVYTYPNPQLDDKEQHEKYERLRKFAEELPQKMYKKMRRDATSLWVKINKVDSAIAQAQKKAQKAFFKGQKKKWHTRAQRLSLLKENLAIYETLLQVPWESRLSYLQNNKLVSKYNRNEIIGYELGELFHVILHNHSIEEYVADFK
ncbi:hypothetical protein [Candidatus Uabimicrobium amorphum]|uniref:Uncharacterized protein n=1 Tax=Uabimicrobium amorphum TaxID=2596890 RepID=A0A5S9F694_UABAM|nr:hypothetical protein [Candidatus Uabimicrobium amorphum]BBM87452.1 hypothetical protein UABAM_05861 [Candidatus Uabimicrobium amorphum]